jgi:SpoVK/Ycf46/Vps4 family AAA+-type ATPase
MFASNVPNPDIFKAHFNKGKEAFDQGKYPQAQIHFVDAAEAMHRLVVSSPIPEIRKSREEGLKALLELAKACGDEPSKTAAFTANQGEPSGKGSDRASQGTDDRSTLDVRQLLFKGSKVRFDDVIGHEFAKEQLRDKMIHPYLNPTYFEAFKVEAGGAVLLFGPPGTGKTDLGAAAAAEINADFYVVKGSDLISKWVGEGEKNVRALFEGVKKNSKRAIIFLDDCHHLISKGHADSSGVEGRMLNEFLNALDGMGKRSDNGNDSTVLFMAATNEPWEISPGILSRFKGAIVYMPLPTQEDRVRILELKMVDASLLDSSVDFHQIASATEGFSGRDLTGLCESVRVKAAKMSAEAGQILKVTQEMFIQQLPNRQPTSKAQEIKRFERWDSQRI